MKTSLHPIMDFSAGKFNLQYGGVFDIKNPTPEMININDIANALSKIPRFGGHTPDGVFYSVAQHSILVHDYAPPYLKKAALLHDASEAYLGDVIKPLKELLGETYSTIEDNVTRVIFQKYNIKTDDLESIKYLDLDALYEEFTQFFHGTFRFRCYNHSVMNGAFLNVFKSCFPEFAKEAQP